MFHGPFFILFLFIYFFFFLGGGGGSSKIYLWLRTSEEKYTLAKEVLPKIHPWLRNLGPNSDPWERHTPKKGPHNKSPPPPPTHPPPTPHPSPTHPPQPPPPTRTPSPPHPRLSSTPPPHPPSPTPPRLNCYSSILVLKLDFTRKAGLNNMCTKS